MNIWDLTGSPSHVIVPVMLRSLRRMPRTADHFLRGKGQTKFGSSISILRLDADTDFVQFMRLITATYTKRYKARCRSLSEGRAHQGRFKIGAKWLSEERSC